MFLRPILLALAVSSTIAATSAVQAAPAARAQTAKADGVARVRSNHGFEETDGSVWLAWTDFRYLAKRYRVTTQDAQFTKAATAAGAIAADAAN